MRIQKRYQWKIYVPTKRSGHKDEKYGKIIYWYPGDEQEVKKYWNNVAEKTTKYAAVYLKMGIQGGE